MKRLLAPLLAFGLALVSTGCGNVFVAGGFHPGFSTVTGTVTLIEVNTVISNGSSFEVTFVSFLVGGVSSRIGFCGDQSNQFPLNQMVTTNFTPGQSCATLVVVVIVT